MNMRRRFRRFTSWSIPLVYVTVTVAVGEILPRLEHRFLPDWDSTISVNSAIAITSSIASGMIALTGIRFYGGTSVQVMRRMNALIQNLLEVLPPARHAALNYWGKRLEGTVDRSFTDHAEKHDASVADRQGLGIGDE